MKALRRGEPRLLEKNSETHVAGPAWVQWPQRLVGAWQTVLRSPGRTPTVQGAGEGWCLLSASPCIRASQQYAVSQSDTVLLILEMKEMKLQEVQRLEPRPSEGSLGCLMLGLKGGVSFNLWVSPSEAPRVWPIESQLFPTLIGKKAVTNVLGAEHEPRIVSFL